ncbi:MAG TPA: YdbL family protein, partial [Gammaproteobacteria bacterium]|nr:YdbL family protein [Gammaproteobacteria bacterium]
GKTPVFHSRGGTMKSLRIPVTLALLAFVAACVTINVYFPAEAAERAADRIIRDVYGEPSQQTAPAEPQSLNRMEPVASTPPMLAVLEWLVSPVAAEADISVNTPAIRQLEGAMEKRHRQLARYYTDGAVGMTQNGEITIRDQKLIALQDRNTVKGLVASENRDRNALYAEIAKANGHPEWEAEIRQIFSRRWIDNAPSGWWYQDGKGGWKRK